MSNDTKAYRALDALMAFNRKERYHVIRFAVTGGPWTLSDRFREELHKELRPVLEMPIPDNAYVAMDYHLDWLSAACQIAEHGAPPWQLDMPGDPYPNYPEANGDPVVTGGPEDIDLLIAFVHDDRLNVIMVEAKADGGWGNQQLGSKLPRLKEILGESRDTTDWIIPYLMFLSPTAPPVGYGNNSIKTENWPRWALTQDGAPYHVPFKPTRTLFRPKRTDKDEHGDYRKWRVTETKGFSPDDNSEEG